MQEDRDKRDQAGAMDRRRVLGALVAAPAAVVAVPTVAKAADEDELAERLMRELEGVDRETAREALEEARERLSEEAIEAAEARSEAKDENGEDEDDEEDDDGTSMGDEEARSAQQEEQGRGQGRGRSDAEQQPGNQGRDNNRGNGRSSSGRQPAEPGHAHNYVENASNTDQPRYRSGQACQNCQFWTQMVDDPYGRCVHPSFRNVLVNKNGWCSVYSPSRSG